MHINCSGLARPMICAGFIFLKLPRSEDTTASKEGTAASEYFEKSLTNRPIGLVDSNGYYFDEDMKFYIDPIALDVKERAQNNLTCETKIDWQTKSGIEIKGRPDVTFIDKHERLCVEDFKYGWGLVEIKENWQLIAYAIGEIIRRGQAFSEISLKIHQPRPHHEEGVSREWVISYDELLEYKEKIENRMQEIVDGRRDLQTSDQCKYCKGTGEACPAFNRLYYRSLEISTEFFQDSLNEEELAEQLDQIRKAEEVIKIKKDSLTELAISRIKQGLVLPNYVISESYGNRKWRDGISPEAIELMTGRNIIEKIMMSPSKAEKVGVSKELVKQLTERAYLGNKLTKKNTKEIGNTIFGNTNPNGGK